MDKTELSVLLKQNLLYDNNPDYLSFYNRLLSSPYASELVSVQKNAKPLYIRDVWNAYAYGDIIKFVYVKNRATPKKKKDLSTMRGEVEGIPADALSKVSKDDERFLSSISRARQRVFELAMCNEFQHFCTFTVNEKFKDRNDLAAVRRDLAQLVRNINRDNPDNEKISYVLIPEQHKKGGWHLHGLMSGLQPYLTEFSTADKIPLKLKKRIKNGEKIYNFPRYARKFGFFTASTIKDKNACSVYVTKYISKEMGKTLLSKGQHLFFASQGLKGRETIVKNCFDLPPFDVWDFENDYVKIKTVSLSEK